MFNQRLKNKILGLETRIYNNDYGWSSHDKRIRELYERVAKLENKLKYGSDRDDTRLKIVEDTITMIAQALDSHGIEKPCFSCGQKLPKEKSK